MQKTDMDATWKRIFERHDFDRDPKVLIESTDPALRIIGVLAQKLTQSAPVLDYTVSSIESLIDLTRTALNNGTEVHYTIRTDAERLTAQLNERDAYMEMLDQAIGIYLWAEKAKGQTT